MALDLSRYVDIDWDDQDVEDSNLAHCLQPEHLGPTPERVVYEVLMEDPVEVRMVLHTAEFAVVGPDFGRTFWLLLLRTSPTRADYIRPVTGWRAGPNVQAQWHQAHGQGRRGRNA